MYQCMIGLLYYIYFFSHDVWITTCCILYDRAGGIGIGTPHTMTLVWCRDVLSACLTADTQFDGRHLHGFFGTVVTMWTRDERGAWHGVIPSV